MQERIRGTEKKRIKSFLIILTFDVKIPTLILGLDLRRLIPPPQLLQSSQFIAVYLM